MLTPRKRVCDMTCEDMRSELKVMRRKVSGDKSDLRSRLREVCNENDRGWLRNVHGQTTGGAYLASGEHRHVYAATYSKGPRKGEPAVYKVFKTPGCQFERQFFDQDIRAVQKAASIIREFNEMYEHYTLGEDAIKRIYLNQPEVWTSVGDETELCLVEPRIEGRFVKFNSNTGWVLDSDNLSEALTHFSYHRTKGAFLLCDIQGGEYPSHFVLTDPVVHSVTREFGATDGGPEAMTSFFARHRCGRFCQPGWARAAPYGMPARYAAVPGTRFFVR